MNNVVNVETSILNECIRGRVPVTVFLVNGFQMRGIITNIDALVIVLETDGKQQMIYKHAVSTVVPVKPVKIKTTVT